MPETVVRNCLDIGCSDKKKPGFIGLDNRFVDGVDIVHDLDNIPLPFNDGELYAINASHILEHIKPWKIFELMDELWRILEVGGGLDIRVPVGISYKLDPSHTIEFNHASFWYWDSRKPMFKTYNPKPWKIIHTETVPEEIRVILQKEKV